MNNRLLKELRKLYLEQSNKPLLQNDYLIYFDDDNITKVHAIIKGPYESVYRHKFIRLDFDIPDNYPHSPPKVTFINYDSVRIHPNFYQDGKCCSTILNTWPSEKERWSSSMGIETILVMFHSFLDYTPYVYEPGGRDDQTYTSYVLYQTWSTCLIRYLQHEKITLFQQFIENYLLTHIDGVFNDLYSLSANYPYGYYACRCFEIDNYIINYTRITDIIQEYYNYINYTENIAYNKEIDFEEFRNLDYNCNICFDTQNDSPIVTLNCNHKFHKNCLNEHVNTNQKLCSMCRREISDEEISNINDNDVWIINPLTKRKVKVGSRTYKSLVEQRVI